MQNGILVLDFGSQYTQLIARRLREIGIYSELLRFDTPIEDIRAKSPKGIVLSGGPSSVFESDAPHRAVRELLDVAPVLGICYGMQLLCKDLGGTVEKSKQREYGLNEVRWSKPMGVPEMQRVWMSHGDVIKTLPAGVEIVAQSKSNHPAAIRGERFWGLQFHPEVSHTEFGTDLLKSFVYDFCGAEKNWSTALIAEHLIEEAKALVPKDETILCALSGGVDSTVTATLLTKAFGRDKVQCVFVNNGLLRKDEFETVLELYKELDLNVKGVDASREFLAALKGVSDPEQKRKIIGRMFIETFKKSIQGIGRCDWLAQGTLYPDVIESVSPRGTSVTIKSHHNVGGLPKDLDLKLVEPLRELFKDEVRRLGGELGVPNKFLQRHPFPGPGLAIRILGDVNEADLQTLKEADAIYVDELKANGLYDQIWQAFCVLLPVRSVGVQGDGRTYEKVICLRAVTSLDGMTANWFDFSHSFLSHVSNRITNEVSGVNRVVYDVTSKPPGTIEWE